jgi:anti-sigma B factor antagonist
MPRAATKPAPEPTLILLREQSLAIPLRIDAVERGGSLVLVVEGELDIVTSHSLDEALECARSTDAARIVVDLRAVSFIDSTGLHVLIKHAATEERCPRIRLTKGSAQVQRLFELSGASEHLPFVSE